MLFLRRLYDLTIGVTCPSFYIRLTREARADLHMWHEFMLSFNGCCMFLNDNWLSSQSLQLYTDAASTIGCAGVFKSEWFAFRWTPPFKKHHINTLELFPIVVAVEIWGHKMKIHKITFFSDNEATVYVINKQSSKDTDMMKLIRRLVLLSLKYNILFRAQFVAGVYNTTADQLSRFNFQTAFQTAPWLQLPEHLLVI